MTFIPSEEQAAILTAVETTTENVAIRALAGCGKTTILVEIAKRLPTTKQGGRRISALFCAFNKAIVGELQKRLEGTSFITKTFHGIGFGALRSYAGKNGLTALAAAIPNGNKYREIVRAWADESTSLRLAVADFIKDITDPKTRQQAERELLKDAIKAGVDLTHFARVTLTNADDLHAVLMLIFKYRLGDDLYDDEAIIEVLARALPQWLARGEALAKADGLIDFDDQIYLPVKWNLKVWQNDYVMVDEAQDISAMQRALIAKSLLPGGRIFIVGDPNQAIYSFAGADADSFDLTVQTFDAAVYPMTLTRRCGLVVTYHAAGIVPEFRCLPDKPRGSIVWLPEEFAVKELTPGDLVACRIKAPLVKLLLNLLVSGKPAIILGGKYVRDFVDILERVEGRTEFEFDQLDAVLDIYETERVAKFIEKHDEVRAEEFQDQMDALRFIIDAARERFNPLTNMDTLKGFINTLFGDEATGKIILATAHKSKGLEADRVFILAPERLPLQHPKMTPEQQQQEYNLDYVVRTRAKTTLVILTNDDYTKRETPALYMQHGFDGTPAQMDLNAPSQTITITKPEPLALPAPVQVITEALHAPLVYPNPLGAWFALNSARAPLMLAAPMFAAMVEKPAAIKPPMPAQPAQIVPIVDALPADVLALLSRIANDELGPFSPNRLPEYRITAAALLKKYATALNNAA